MNQFKRENRYCVAKNTDIDAALSEDEKFQLNTLLQKVDQKRQDAGKAPLECVVVESDWANYEKTWAEIERIEMTP